MSARDVYYHMVRLITPRPIAWVSSLSAAGTANLAPYSFFNGVGANPPTVVFCPANRRDGSPKDTLVNIRQTGEFVVNLVPDRLGAAMNQTSADLPADESEFPAAGLTATASRAVAAPRVLESPAHLECVLHHAVQLGVGPLGANLIVGRIVWIHIDPSVLNAQQLADAEKLDLIGRLGGSDYCRTRDRFEMGRPE
jgi:flavin reductase (DIM6/NTAB) family NADH-FMN oxidoreductase RutF